VISEAAVAAADRVRQAGGFLADVLCGLSGANKTLPCKYFYDQAGSQLFDQICALPEYYVTRAEIAILRRHGPEIARRVGSSCTLLEFGSGNGSKMRLLLKHLRPPLAYVPIDIAYEQLQRSARALAADYPFLRVFPLCADFTNPVDLPGNGSLFGRRVVYFPGSTIGNFTPEETVRLLRRTAELCRPGGGLLLTADLKKDPRVITAAYNDHQGVTAAFNLNLLTRMNRELGADFAVEKFWHHAFYEPRHGRVEMHLVSRAHQRAIVAGHGFEFREGESICTEYSHKYSLQDLRELAACGNFQVRQVWRDGLKYVTMLYLTACG
jgi:dimethylhistidine N-methyltransferase